MLKKQDLSILITGANGFIGSYFMEYFKKRNYEVVGVIRNKETAQDGFDYIISDLGREEIESDKHFHIIIHCAAELGRTAKKMEQFVVGNIISTKNVLDFARKNKTNKIINLNGVRHLGEIRDRVISEDSHIYNPGYYGITKSISEKMLLDSDIPVVSLILPCVVGKKGHTGWIMRISKDFMQNITVDCYEPEAMFNNIIHIDTLSRIVEELLYMKTENNERILLGSKNCITKYETLSHLKKGLNSCSDIRICDSKEISFWLDLSKANSMNLKLPVIEEELDKLICDLNG